jgi:hypothetical protein
MAKLGLLNEKGGRFIFEKGDAEKCARKMGQIYFFAM